MPVAETEIVSEHGSLSASRSKSASRSPSRSKSTSRSRSGSRGRRHRSHRRSLSRDRRHYRKRSRSRSRSFDRSYRRRSRSRSPYSSRRRHIASRVLPTARVNATYRLNVLQENPPPTRCLGVFGLSTYTTERDLHQFFNKWGAIEGVHLVYDHPSGRSRGFGFVYFERTEDAIIAKEHATGVELDGQRIRVDFSITKRPHTPTPGIYMGQTRKSYRDDYHRGRSDGGYYNRRRSRSGSYSPRRFKDLIILRTASDARMRGKAARSWFTSCADELLRRHNSSAQSIITFSQELDDTLGGGIPLGRLTECSGLAGTGKTQICLQLAVNARIPEAVGGIHGEVVYIDTEGAFRIKRLEQIARFAVQHCLNSAETNEQRKSMDCFSMNSILSGIHVQRCSDLFALRVSIRCLPEFLVGRPGKVKLVIVDSIAMHLRDEFQSAVQRCSVINSVVTDLLSIALRFNIAVFVTNQVTTKMLSNGTAYTTPTLGYRLSCNSTHQLCIFAKQNNVCYVHLAKSSMMPPSTVRFAITEKGIRDVIDNHQRVSVYQE